MQIGLVGIIMTLSIIFAVRLMINIKDKFIQSLISITITALLTNYMMVNTLMLTSALVISIIIDIFIIKNFFVENKTVNYINKKVGRFLFKIDDKKKVSLN